MYMKKNSYANKNVCMQIPAKEGRIIKYTKKNYLRGIGE